MNKAFEKILERLETADSVKVFGSLNSGNRLIPVQDAKQIVQEVDEEYNDGWIPCSERLPKYGEVVMCSCSNGGITISCITHRGVNQSKVVRFGSHSVVAWQSLPEPFKESD